MEDQRKDIKMKTKEKLDETIKKKKPEGVGMMGAILAEKSNKSKKAI
jgi:hypothetical protein